MADVRFRFEIRARVVLLTLAWTLHPPLEAVCQATRSTAQTNIAIDEVLPPKVQAEFDKLQGELRAARSAGDPERELVTINSFGELHSRTSGCRQALEDYSRALTLARLLKDVPQEAAALNGTGSCNLVQGQAQKALETFQQALDLRGLHTKSHENSVH